MPVSDLPITDPILIFGIAMIAFLIAPLLISQYRLPGLIGIILAGAIIGPNALGVLDRSETFVLLGEVGIVYLMFLAGLEINVNQFIKFRNRSIVFGFLSFFIPQVIGTAVGYWIIGFDLPAALLFASIFASHTLLAYPVINKLGLATNESVTVSIGGTILTDTLALLVLAGVVASVGERGAGIAFWVPLSIGLALYFIGVWTLVPRISRWFFRTVDEESYFEFLFVMAVLFVCAYLAELVGVEHIIGAFLAGLVLNRHISDTGPLMNRIEFVGNALFIPFFLISVGMLVDVRVLFEGMTTIWLTGAFIVLVLSTKYLAARLTGYFYRYSPAEINTMFGLSLGQAAAALAIVLIGYDQGLFTEHVLNATILMILLVSVISPTIVDQYGREIVRAEATEVYEPRSSPPRVMVPFSRGSRHRDDLLELAMLIRGDSPEPLYTLTVAELGTDTQEQVAAVEAFLAETREYSAGAEVPVETRIKVKRNQAAGIIESVLENRISTLVIGWDGASSRRQSIFGHTIDRVLARTKELVFVSHIRERISSTRTVVLILPPGTDYDSGFPEAIHLIKRLGDQIGASLHVLVLGRESGRCQRLIEMIDPDLPIQFSTHESWSQIFDTLRMDVDSTDLVVVMSARRGTIGWDSELETIPMRISRATPGNFIIVYPPLENQSRPQQFLRMR